MIKKSRYLTQFFMLPETFVIHENVAVSAVRNGQFLMDNREKHLYLRENAVQIATQDTVLTLKKDSHIDKVFLYQALIDAGLVDAAQLVQRMMQTERVILEHLTNRGNHAAPRLFENKDENTISMEFVDGKSLAQHRWRHPTELCHLISELCRVVINIFEDGVVNLDLASRNIVADLDHVIAFWMKMVDFELAQIVQDGKVTIDPDLFELKEFFPPEVESRRDSIQAFQVDAERYVAYTLGCTVREIANYYINDAGLSTRPKSASPFRRQTPASFYDQFWLRAEMNGMVENFGEEQTHSLACGIESLLLGLQDEDPNKRISLVAALAQTDALFDASLVTFGKAPSPVYDAQNHELVKRFADGTVVVDRAILCALEAWAQ